MRKSCSVLILSLSIILIAQATTNSTCRRYIHSVSALYDIHNLTSENNYEYSWGPHSSHKIKFNLCKEVHGTCGSQDNTAAAAFYYENNECHKLTDNSIPQMNP